MLKKLMSVFIKILLILLPTLLLIRIILAGYSLSWTGFSGKTLWDWMSLFIIPLVLGIGAFLLNYSERKSERQQAEERRKIEQSRVEEQIKLERELAIDRQREETLQTYFDRMSELLLKDRLRSTKNKEVRNVARTRTLSVLRGLDGVRKGLLIKFLYESQLISKGKSIINLNDADLSEANLIVTMLNNINLKGANLKKANFEFAILNGADLSKTNLEKANLTAANLSNADLTSALLWGADLTFANLSNADLTSALLRDADFKKANLNGTKVQMDDIKK